MITINDRLSIPEDEIAYEVSTSSGPGGQNVNRLHTRVTLTFDLGASGALDPADRERIRDRLGRRINKAGVLRVSSERHRSQALNRDDATARFVKLLRKALEEAVPRKPTRIPRREKARRLEDKRHRSVLKKNRWPADPD